MEFARSLLTALMTLVALVCLGWALAAHGGRWSVRLDVLTHFAPIVLAVAVVVVVYGALAETGGARLALLAIGGLETDKDRIEETRKILEWSMTAFEKRRLFEAGEPVGDAAVYGGMVGHVPLVTAEPVDVLVPANNPDRLVARVVYRWPLPMPIKAGQPAGTLKVWNGDRLLRGIPVTTASAVEIGSLSSRALDALQEMLFFWL